MRVLTCHFCPQPRATRSWRSWNARRAGERAVPVDHVASALVAFPLQALQDRREIRACVFLLCHIVAPVWCAVTDVESHPMLRAIQSLVKACPCALQREGTAAFAAVDGAASCALYRAHLLGGGSQEWEERHMDAVPITFTSSTNPDNLTGRVGLAVGPAG